MVRFSGWGAVGMGLVVGSSVLSSSCGESTRNPRGPSTPGDGGAAGDPATSGGSGARAGSAGRAGSGSQGGSGNQAGAPEPAGGDVPVMNGGAPLGDSGAPGAGAGAGGEGLPDPTCVDEDGDGYVAGAGCLVPLDCDDANPLVNPSMLELADDGKDNDCVDGDLKAVTGPGYYVNGSDANCSDANDAVGTKLAPYCTIEIAVLRAYQNTTADDKVGRSIFVAKGTYPNTTGTPRSMRVYGGYDASDWSYNPAQNVTTIGGADVMQDLDGFSGLSSWLSVNVKATAVIQGFHIQGGKKPGAPIFAVEINSSGKVELYDNVISAGEGYQTMGINVVAETKTDPATSNVWLIKNRISAGAPTNSSNYGVNNLGTAVLWGNVIDMGQGSGLPQAFGAAVQNYGRMTLVNNVLNGGSYGTAVDTSLGLRSGRADSMPPAVTLAYHNVIFGGRGRVSSFGVDSENTDITLVSNVIGDRTPGPLTFAERPTTVAAPLTTGFTGNTVLQSNDLFQLIYSDEAGPPNVAANRHLLGYSDLEPPARWVDDLALVNAGQWNTSAFGGVGSNLAVDPGFVGAGDFHLADASPLLAMGAPPEPTTAGGLANIDIDGVSRIHSEVNIGIAQR